MRSKARLAGFDGLRAIAALSVVVYHIDFFAPTSAHWIRPLLQQLRAGVWVFFALSGFLLYRNWAAAHLDDVESPAIGAYLRNRCLRIFPAFWVALVFFTAIHRTLLDPSVGIAAVVRQFTLTQIYSTRDIVAQVGLPRGLPHTWSLAVEVSFYLALPLYAAVTGVLGKRMGKLRAEYLGLGALGLGWLAWTTATRGNAIHQQWLPNFAMAFGVGIGCAVFATDHAASTVPRRVGAWLGEHGAIAWCSAAAALFVRSRLHIRFENGIESQLLYATAAVLLVAPVVFDGSGGRRRMVRYLESPVVRFLGKISYGIFVWHYLLIVVIRNDWLHRPTGNLSALRLGLVVLPVLVAVATASWYLVERPVLATSRGGALSFRAGATLVAAGGLAWRVLYVLAERGRLKLHGDAAYYHLQANAVAKGLGFVDPFQWVNDHRLVPSAGHPPAFILYLAAVTRLGGHSEVAHRLASCLLGGATVFVIAYIGRALNGPRTGLVAAVIAAGYANLFINDEMLMSESMAALAAALVVLTIVRYRAEPSRRRAVQLGAAIGFAALSRAELLALALLVAVPLIARRVQLDRTTRVRQVAVTLVTTLAFVTPWMLYNVGRFHHPVLMSNGLGGVLLVGNCNDTYYGQLLGYWSPTCGGTVAVDPRGDESDHELRWRHAGLHYIGEHLDRIPVVAIARAARMWDVWRRDQNAALDGAIEGRGVGAARLAADQYAVLGVLALVGLWLLRRRRVMIWPYLAIAALVTFTAVTSFGVTRYRVPVEVVLPGLAAVSCVAGFEWLTRRVQSRWHAPTT